MIGNFLKNKKSMITITSTGTKVVSNTKLFIAVFAMFGAGAVALALLPLNTSLNKVNMVYKTVNGCHMVLKYNNLPDKELIFSVSQDKCSQYYLAGKYAGGKDLYRLLYSESLPVSNNKLDIVSSFRADFNFVDSMAVNSFIDIYNKIYSTKCEEISYFGVRLYCFNQKKENGVVVKQNNLLSIIPSLTVLKYGSSVSIAGVSTRPIDYLSKVVYYDSTPKDGTVTHFDMNLTDVQCGDNFGAANYGGTEKEINTTTNKIFVCAKSLSKDSGVNRIQRAAILLHEAGHYHAYQKDNNDVGHVYYHPGIDEPMIFSTITPTMSELYLLGTNSSVKFSACKNIKDYTGANRNSVATRDLDFNSVYGLHINYLYKQSQNPVFDCEERNFAYKQADLELVTKLCRYPTVHKLGPAPVCNN